MKKPILIAVAVVGKLGGSMLAARWTDTTVRAAARRGIVPV